MRLTTDRAGYGFAQDAGAVLDLPSAEARALCKSGQAEPARDEDTTPDRQPRGKGKQQ